MIDGRHILWAGLLLSFMLPLSVAQESSRASARKTPTGTIHVHRLGHTTGDVVIEALRALDLAVLAAKAGPHMVVLQGSEEDIQKAIGVIAHMDIPETMLGEGLETAVFSMAVAPTSDLLELVDTIVETPGSGIALDEVSRMLVVRATDEEIHAVEELISEIDRPRESLMVHFFFIGATIGGTSTSDRSQLPPALTPIAKTLSDNGFGNLLLLAPITVVAHGSQEFDSDSTLRFGDKPADKPSAGSTYERTEEVAEEKENYLTFSVEGVARLEPDEETVQLTVEASMYGKFPDEESHGSFDANFNVDTTIALKLDSYVILAASPSSTSRGNAVALVVRVTKQPAAGTARE